MTMPDELPPETRGTERLRVVPISFGEASAFVFEHHRHHPPTVGHKFSVAVADDNNAVRGVAVVGRPVARHNDDGWTLEVTRVATDGAANACSMLYAACWRAARSLGYRRLITYTLKTEPGTSLRAAGWRVIGEVAGRSWTCKSRPRVDKHPTLDKLCWSAA
jgi:hypothetical protein